MSVGITAIGSRQSPHSRSRDCGLRRRLQKSESRCYRHSHCEEHSGGDKTIFRRSTAAEIPSFTTVFARMPVAIASLSGASRHGLLDTLIGEETAAHIAQLGNVPLLVASPGMRRLPHRVAIAMDLDPSQLGDLPPVLSMFGPAASVTCVHVHRREDFPGSGSPARSRYDAHLLRCRDGAFTAQAVHLEKRRSLRNTRGRRRRKSEFIESAFPLLE
jgi:hypothetical protein